MITPRIVSVLVSSVLVFAGVVGFSAPAQANGCISHVTGDGSSARPYLISTPTELTCMQQNAADYWGAGLYFRQTADISLTGYVWPAGIGNNLAQFQGHYDGGSFTIDNFTLTVTHAASQLDSGVGLFGFVALGASVENLNLTRANISVTGSGNSAGIGAIAGYSEGTISHVTGQGVVHIDEAGYVANVGGIVGKVSEGLISHISSDVEIDVATRGSSSRHMVSIGGVIGNAEDAAISQVHAAGSITVRSGSWAEQVGGVFGRINRVAVVDAYSTVDLSITTVQAIYGLALIAGTVDSSAIDRVYASGVMVSSSGEPAEMVGGIVGSSVGFSDLTNSFWNTSLASSALNAVGQVTNGTLTNTGNSGQTSGTLQQLSTFNTTSFVTTPWLIANGWDDHSSATWGICDGSGMPFLWSLTSVNPCPTAPAVVPVVAPESSAVAAEIAQTAAPEPVDLVLALTLVLAGAVLVLFARRRYVA